MQPTARKVWLKLRMEISEKETLESITGDVEIQGDDVELGRH